MSDLKKVDSVDNKGKEVTVYLKKPNVKDYRESQAAYNKAFRTALENGAILKQKLNDYMREQGVWDDKKESKYRGILKQIGDNESALKSGGIPLQKAREIALQTRKLRAEFNELISERQQYENNSAEGQADNARFDAFVISCVVDQNGNRIWKSLEEYENSSNETWANRAASELASDLYGLDPDYYNNLFENQFLTKYKFANKDLRLINKDGHLIDASGKLINEDGRYVAYRENGEQYFVDFDGNEVDENGEKLIQFSPFLDDDGKPVLVEEDTEVELEESTAPKKGRKKKETPE
jgi:hypothetical protein